MSADVRIRAPERLRVAGSSLWLVLREAGQSFSANRDMASAATLAYYGFLALMPLLLLVIYLLGLFLQSSEAVLAGVEDLAARLFPSFNRALLVDLLSVARGRAWGLISVVLLFWSLMPFAGAIRAAVRRIFRAAHRASFLRSKLLDLSAVLVLLLLFLLMAGGKVYASLGPVRLLARAGAALACARALGSAALAVGVLAFFYRVFAPGKIRLPHLLAGALAAAALLAVVRPLFGLILKYNPNYGYAFGSLKAIFLLLVWAYYTFAVLLFGAEVVAMTQRRDALLLRRLFAGGPEARTSRVLLGRFVRAAADGEVLFREGDPGAEMFYVLEGSVRLTRAGRELRVMGPGEYFGEMSMLLGAPRAATAVASGPGTRLAAISQKNFEVILGENPAIVFDLLKEMARRLEQTNRKLEAGPPRD
ncbi:MAG TPA: YhjD/YihY/BrkB family envelope integrity protein [Kiritimatiellia bacterium]|nr:YhjD/YihY/BrkB family envelope integrity protein [Kiritimatiellia bacterium]HRZ10967.1 YhjD/YihY/BrkB family envelope integrity protein [Kiritimatiellia bacterium]HSA18540.1 YhjD/YihY/BrkB family envelope integrity protein [Kiritimatiellia bacterium]